MDQSFFSDQPLPKQDSSLFSEEPAPKQNSAVESAIHGFVNNVPFGTQAASAIDSVLGPKSYSENLAGYNKTFAEAKKQHPVAYGAGATAGALAPLVIPGVGEAMEAAPIASGAVLGATNAANNTDLVQEPGKALKEGAEGAAMGAATSWGLGKIFPEAESLENFAKTKGLQSTGISTKQLGDLSEHELESAKNFVADHGLIGTDKEEVLKKALEKEKEFGEKIGGIGKHLDSAGIRASEDDILGAVSKLQNKAAETANLENPELRKLSIWHTKGANDIFNKVGDNPTWESIQKLKNSYGKAAFTDTGEVKNEASKNVYFVLRDMLKDLTQKAQDNPNLPEEYKTALAGYHTIDPVIDGLHKLVGLERAGVSHGGGHGFLAKIIHSLPGQSNPAVNLGTAAAATMVSPHLGPLMALPTLTNPAIQSKVASSVASHLPGIQQGASQELIDFLASKYGRRNEK